MNLPARVTTLPKGSFPWTTVVVFVTTVSAIVVLTVTRVVGADIIGVFSALLPGILFTSAYAENTNRAVKNGLIVDKSKQALDETGVTAAVARSDDATAAAMGALTAHTAALTALVDRLTSGDNNPTP